MKVWSYQSLEAFEVLQKDRDVHGQPYFLLYPKVTFVS